MQYTTAALAEALEIPGTTKTATRELRKFLRATIARDEQPGKGGRYALDLTKPQLRKMGKDFAAWAAKQEAEKKARREALDALKKAPKADPEPIEDEADNSDEGDEEAEGPSDEEIAEMLSEINEEDNA